MGMVSRLRKRHQGTQGRLELVKCLSTNRGGLALRLNLEDIEADSLGEGAK